MILFNPADGRKHEVTRLNLVLRLAFDPSFPEKIASRAYFLMPVASLVETFVGWAGGLKAIPGERTVLFSPQEHGNRFVQLTFRDLYSPLLMRHHFLPFA